MTDHQRDRAREIPAGEADAGRRPAIVLVAPQLGENIGAAARAMYNFGLTDLRLVSPRDGWPNARANAMAAGAENVVEAARVFDSLDAAIADVQYLCATTARLRDMVKPAYTPRQAAEELARRQDAGARCGVLFGAERSGLENEHVAMADAIVHVPVNPAFGSLNLAQAVLLVAYEWFQWRQTADRIEGPRPLEYNGGDLATGADLAGLFAHLERELSASGYFYPLEKRAVMARTIRNALQRAQFSYQEVQILRGVIKALSHGRPPRR